MPPAFVDHREDITADRLLQYEIKQRLDGITENIRLKEQLNRLMERLDASRAREGEHAVNEVADSEAAVEAESPPIPHIEGRAQRLDEIQRGLNEINETNSNTTIRVEYAATEVEQVVSRATTTATATTATQTEIVGGPDVSGGDSNQLVEVQSSSPSSSNKTVVDRMVQTDHSGELVSPGDKSTTDGIRDATLDQKDKELEVCRAQLKESQAEVAAANSQLQQAYGELHAADSAHVQLAAELSTAREELAGKTKELRDVDQDRLAALSKANQLEVDLADAEKKLEESTCQQTRLEQQVSVTKTELDTALEKLEESNRVVASITVELEKLIKSMAEAFEKEQSQKANKLDWAALRKVSVNQPENVVVPETHSEDANSKIQVPAIEIQPETAEEDMTAEAEGPEKDGQSKRAADGSQPSDDGSSESDSEDEDDIFAAMLTESCRRGDEAVDDRQMAIIHAQAVKEREEEAALTLAEQTPEQDSQHDVLQGVDTGRTLEFEEHEDVLALHIQPFTAKKNLDRDISGDLDAARMKEFEEEVSAKTKEDKDLDAIEAEIEAARIQTEMEYDLELYSEDGPKSVPADDEPEVLPAAEPPKVFTAQNELKVFASKDELEAYIAKYEPEVPKATAIDKPTISSPGRPLVFYSYYTENHKQSGAEADEGYRQHRLESAGLVASAAPPGLQMLGKSAVSLAAAPFIPGVSYHASSSSDTKIQPVVGKDSTSRSFGKFSFNAVANVFTPGFTLSAKNDPVAPLAMKAKTAPGTLGVEPDAVVLRGYKTDTDAKVRPIVKLPPVSLLTVNVQTHVPLVNATEESLPPVTTTVATLEDDGNPKPKAKVNIVKSTAMAEAGEAGEAGESTTEKAESTVAPELSGNTADAAHDKDLIFGTPLLQPPRAPRAMLDPFAAMNKTFETNHFAALSKTFEDIRNKQANPGLQAPPQKEPEALKLFTYDLPLRPKGESWSMSMPLRPKGNVQSKGDNQEVSQQSRSANVSNKAIATSSESKPIDNGADLKPVAKKVESLAPESAKVEKPLETKDLATSSHAKGKGTSTAVVHLPTVKPAKPVISKSSDAFKAIGQVFSDHADEEDTSTEEAMTPTAPTKSELSISEPTESVPAKTGEPFKSKGMAASRWAQKETTLKDKPTEEAKSPIVSTKAVPSISELTESVPVKGDGSKDKGMGTSKHAQKETIAKDTPTEEAKTATVPIKSEPSIPEPTESVPAKADEGFKSKGMGASRWAQKNKAATETPKTPKSTNALKPPVVEPEQTKPATPTYAQSLKAKPTNNSGMGASKHASDKAARASKFGGSTPESKTSGSSAPAALDRALPTSKTGNNDNRSASNNGKRQGKRNKYVPLPAMVVGTHYGAY